MDLKNKIEAVLFAAGKSIDFSEIVRICKCKDEEATETLKTLKKEYEDRKSPMKLIEEGSSWKMTVQDQYVDLVRSIVVTTDLKKSILETLALIAFKSPVLQAEIINSRTSNAYEHINELIERGYITKEKQGRSFILRLSSSFYDYFDISKERTEEIFSDLKLLAEAIQKKEFQFKDSKKQKKKEEKEKKKQEIQHQADSAKNIEEIEKEQGFELRSQEEIDKIESDVPLEHFKEAKRKKGEKKPVLNLKPTVLDMHTKTATELKDDEKEINALKSEIATTSQTSYDEIAAIKAELEKEKEVRSSDSIVITDKTKVINPVKNNPENEEGDDEDSEDEDSEEGEDESDEDSEDEGDDSEEIEEVDDGEE